MFTMAWIVFLFMLIFSTARVNGQTHALDRKSTCGQEFAVYDNPLTFTARSNVAPANPPLSCTVYLESAYEQALGKNRLQIIVEQLSIGDCNVRLDFFNGKQASGNFLRSLGCSSKSTDIIYTTGRQATIRFTRPQDLYVTAYAITFTVETYLNADDIPTALGVDKLPTGAIIGIVIGCIALIAIAILLIWCCCSGYLHRFLGLPGGDYGRRHTVVSRGYVGTKGSIDSNLEKVSTTSSTCHLRNGINYQDPAIWSSLTGLNKERHFKEGMPRRAMTRANGAGDVETRPGDPFYDRDYENNQGRTYSNSAVPNGGVRDSHAYEPYDNEANASPRFRKRQDDPKRGSNRSRGSRRSRNSGTGLGEADGGSKETNLDEDLSSTSDEEMLKKPPSDSEPEEPVKLNRFESEPDMDTIASPMHVNAAVRASIPDLAEEHHSPKHSPRAKKRTSTSPKSRKKPRGPGVDPMGLPPEAFDPVFTTPTSQEQYPGEFRPPQQPAMPFAPYGMFPMVPGQQMYAYAYQTAPHMGAHPGQQGAYFVQSVPTADGDVQNTAFAMQSTRTPKRKGSKGKGGMQHPGPPEYTSTPGQGSPAPDMSLIARGAAPPDPGAGHRSMAMKSFADPDTGMQTTQVLWTDNVPDASDPKPEDSSQVTRKTTTRVTTRSGQGQLPTQTATLLDYQDPNPAFLNPSSAPQPALTHPATFSPSTTNVDYYLGQGQGAEPERDPDVVHAAPSRSGAIRDRVHLGSDSYA